ncbi:short chain dehydrogenase [Actinoallomurus sp. CA-150999]|uniref:short chain dehydrogenase n=1 Tax=Actinoallomurus sp. CA-150999 TaxID=3239887 RepID=UPI003D8FB16F
MKILVIGATGTIGSTAAAVLESGGHEVVRASRNGPVTVDMTDPASIEAALMSVSDLDAVVCCAASGRLTPLASASDEDFTAGLHGKLLGQVTLVRRALHLVRDGGSITLTSGVFDEPTPGGAFGALVNAGLGAFVEAAAIEMPRGLRLNAVSPGWVSETLKAMGEDGSQGTPATEVAHAYLRAIEGTMRGQILIPR